MALKSFFTAILLGMGMLLFPQDAEIPADSLNAISPQDSIPSISILQPTAADSLEATRLRAEAAARIEDTTIDTLNLTQGIKDEIQKVLDLQHTLPLPYLVHRENNHYFAPLENQLLLRWNDFSLHPWLVSQTHLYQSYSPLFHTSSSANGHQYNQANYVLPAALTETWLGIGDLDMTHAVVAFHKGFIMGQQNLALEVSYSGMAGDWYSQSDKASNFNGHLSYKTSAGNFHFYHTAINEETSTAALIPQMRCNAIANLHTTNNAVMWETPLVNLGFRHQHNRVDISTQPDADQWIKSLLLRREFTLSHHQLTAAFEPTWIDNHYRTVATADHRFHSHFISTSTTLHLDDDRLEAYSFGTLRLHPWMGACWELRARSDAPKYQNVWLNAINPQEKMTLAGGVTLLPNSLNVCIMGGKTETDYLRDFLQIRTNGSLPWRNYTLDISAWSRYLPDPGPWLPTWQINADAAIRMHLEHDNSVALGTSLIYASDYYSTWRDADSSWLTHAQNIDIYFTAAVSKLFEIEGRAVNILNHATLFEMVGTNPETHYNVSVRWFFKN